MNPFMTPLIADLDGPMGWTTVGACLEMSGSTNLVSRLPSLSGRTMTTTVGSPTDDWKNSRTPLAPDRRLHMRRAFLAPCALIA